MHPHRWDARAGIVAAHGPAHQVDPELGQAVRAPALCPRCAGVGGPGHGAAKAVLPRAQDGIAGPRLHGHLCRGLWQRRVVDVDGQVAEILACQRAQERRGGAHAELDVAPHLAAAGRAVARLVDDDARDVVRIRDVVEDAASQLGPVAQLVLHHVLAHANGRERDVRAVHAADQAIEAGILALAVRQEHDVPVDRGDSEHGAFGRLQSRIDVGVAVGAEP